VGISTRGLLLMRRERIPRGQAAVTLLNFLKARLHEKKEILVARHRATKERINPNCVEWGEQLWLSGKVAKNEKINENERTRVRSPPRATSLIKKLCWTTIFL
jgi:hypothetical protein